MSSEKRPRTELLQGTLDMLILRTLRLGPAHGHEIAKHIERTSEDVLRLEHGSLYPALHRLEARGWLASKWDAHAELKRDCKYYRLTPVGRKQLMEAESKWKRLQEAIKRVMSAAVRA
jgi:PadR family transcriptional regulator PadR